MPWRKFVVLVAGVLIGGVIAFPRSAPAQVPLSQWVIVPGEGWGPIRLGMTEQEVYAILGAPSSAKGERIRNISFRIQTNLVTMRFGDPFTRAADTQPPQLLSDITLYGGPWGTPEGVHIGSPLSAVLTAYGDTLVPPLPGHVSSCLDLQIIRSPEISPPLPSTLTLTYPRGVGFHVNLSNQKVELIAIQKARIPPDCI